MAWSSLRWQRHSLFYCSTIVRRRPRGDKGFSCLIALNRNFSAHPGSRERSSPSAAAAAASIVVVDRGPILRSYWLCSLASIPTVETSLTQPRICRRHLTTMNHKKSDTKESSTSFSSDSSVTKESQASPLTNSSEHEFNDYPSKESPSQSTNTTATPTYRIKTHQELLQQWLHELQSPPNLITLSRIACTPLISYWIVTGQAEYALCGGLIAGMSDMLDGYLAKRYHMTTVVGTFLDPLADKLLVNVVSFSLYSISMLPGPLVWLWLARDVGLVYFSHQLVLRQSQNNVRIMLDLTRTPLQVQPTTISKINTALQFLTLGTALAHPMIIPWIPDSVLPTLCWVTGATTIASAISYMNFTALTASGNPPPTAK